MRLIPARSLVRFQPLHPIRRWARAFGIQGCVIEPAYPPVILSEIGPVVMPTIKRNLGQVAATPQKFAGNKPRCPTGVPLRRGGKQAAPSAPVPLFNQEELLPKKSARANRGAARIG